MIAVRALSEPFVVSMLDSEGKVKDIKSRIRSAYLFDKNIEEIYDNSPNKDGYGTKMKYPYWE